MPDLDPMSGLPIGLRVDSRPAGLPQAVRLEGRCGAVEHLDISRHRGSLWQALRGQDSLFTYMPFGPFADEKAFSDWLLSCARSRDPFYYAVVDAAGRAAGVAALMSIRPEMRAIEVGNILLSQAVQHTTLATE